MLITANTINPEAGNVCEHCGAPRKRKSIQLLGRKYDVLLSCDCSTASRERDENVTEQPRKAEKYKHAGIGPEYQASTAECAEQVEAVKHGRNVFITGANGCGKSMLAAAIGMSLIDQGYTVLFVNAAIAAQAIRSTYSGEGDSSLWERMCNAPALIIDDLGKGNPTEWDSSIWYTVAEARNAAGIPTVVTTNYTGGELVKRLTANNDDSTARATVSRLRGGALVVKMSGADMRLRNAV